MRRDEVVERVLLAVSQIPAGRVASYGGIAAITGTSPRLVGRIMKDHGSEARWWRVTSRDGDFGGALLSQALPHWNAEGIRVKPNGLGCRFADYAADLDELRDAFLTALTLSRSTFASMAAANATTADSESVGRWPEE